MNRRSQETPEQHARNQALTEWRHIDLAPLEKALAPTARAIANIMPQVLSEMKLDRRRSDAEIIKVWNHLLDPLVVAHAQPTGLHKGTLFVAVDSSVWLDEIVRYRRKEILHRLQLSFGEDLITKISFRIQ